MINKKINELIKYAKANLYLGLDDEYYVANKLIYLLKLNQFEWIPVEEELDFFEIIEPMLDYAFENNIIESNSTISRDAFESKIIDCVMPRPSELTRMFRKHYKSGPLTATTFFHNLSIASNYIKTKRIAKNIKYIYEGKYAPLEITINLSKPEKDPKDILKQSLNKDKYPICPLCMENVGVYQSTSLAPRSNHRVVSLNLNHEKETWGIQYSPYAYFNEHMIVLRKEHSNMYVNEKTFAELVDFINKFPHYLIGSNAGLPIVGGSILGHHHFQGGRYDFPIEKARVLQKYKKRKVEIEILDWPMAAIRVSSNNENALLDMVSDIYKAWYKYENKDLQIYSKTEEDHNTVTPILKLNGAKYNFYIVLRNNYSTKEKPYGLFHPREELFHIKKENIGLIEVMGLAILPGRLVKELDLIEDCLINNKDPKTFNELEKHLDWINHLKEMNIPNEQINETLKKEVGRIFEEVIEDCNVFKYGTNEDLFRFIEKII
ncbi:galactose-1-phosphate uridylyltransferase [Candidatus Izemoplasma sp. B36]|uniref:galactose-1-phosphate uridylyltransferase n=1 Tax=Candidatus Izemoplasma sp. B36 TaxID=3242468 RepID=UPI00355747D2